MTASAPTPPLPTTTTAAGAQVQVQAQVPSTTSHLSLFLTNLRLLDLDRQEDWPGISSAIFSPKDAAGGQKRRIQCVEWALYQLFLLWDEPEAQTRLRPFFPPLDQIQSINLRAALLRGLEQAKRNGVLGRDAVIRKTMLDECRGDRFEEVLAVFSSAVLKKIVAEKALNSGPGYRPTVAEGIALQNWGYSGDRTELNALIIAHKASLRSALAQKQTARAKYQKFQELLELKQRKLAARREQVKASAEEAHATPVPPRLKKQTRQIVRATWTGHEQWVDTILHDESRSRQGGLLSADFDDVWNDVRKGRLIDWEDKSTGLLEQLDQRVKLQRSRLDKWEGFRTNLFGPRTSAPTKRRTTTKGEQRIVDLGFTAHHNLQAEPESAPSFDAFAGPPDYAQILGSLKTELGLLGKPAIPDFSKLAAAGVSNRLSDSLGAPSNVPDLISDLSEWEDDPEQIVPAAKGVSAPATKGLREFTNQLPQTRTSSRPTAQQHPGDENRGSGGIGRTREENSELARRARNRIMEAQQRQPKKEAPDAVSVAVLRASESPSSNGSPEPQFEPALLSPASAEHTPLPKKKVEEDVVESPAKPTSPTQAMADQILASMSNASPSPVKRPLHTLSLAERTRMSMSKNGTFEFDDYDPIHMSPSLVRSARPTRAPKTVDIEPAIGQEYEDLASRTRRSMAGFDAARQKAQADRRKSQRQSKIIHKKDSFFTKQDDEEIGDASIMEELLESQEDMEAVFKSRPKMRISPAPSPVPGWNGNWGRDD